MKHTNKFLSVLIALIMIISIIPMSTITAGAVESETSGTCGENLTWSLNDETGVLTISGTGAMTDYHYYNSPWENNNNIKTVIIGDQVTTIGVSAFYKCKSLTSVTIPDSVTTIGWGAFEYCESLTSVTIPDSVATIDRHAFGRCKSLTNIDVSENNTAFTSVDGVLFNKDKTTLIKYPAGNTRTSYTIPNNVKIVGKDAFEYSESLTSIAIPDSVTSIEMFAFCYCDSLTSVTIPDDVTSIGSWSFAHCSSLAGVILPDNITSIGSYAFYLTSYYNNSLNWENNVLYIGKHLIKAKDSIDGIYRIKEGTKVIAEQAFAYCKSLTAVAIPDSVITIGEEAFMSCLSFTDVYYSGTEAQWNDITIGDYNGTLLNATFHFNHAGHICSFGDWTVTVEPTCTESGIKTRVCECGESETEEIPATGHIGGEEIIKNEIIPTCSTYGSYDIFVYCVGCGINISCTTITVPKLNHEYEYKITKEPSCTETGVKTYTCMVCGDLYTENIPTTSHTSKTITIPATCTVAGMEYNVCETCGEALGDSSVIPATGHTAGKWEVVKEATPEIDGLAVQKCAVCGEILQEKVLSIKKTTATDEDTGISMEFDNSDYNGVVDIVVEESFDGTAFDVIDTTLNASQKFIYDITMTVDGVETQPNGAVTIKIPLPAGYDPNRSFVYHVDTETGKVEKMPATYENGYMVFETTHFSYYAVVEESNYTLSIQNPSRTEIRNKDGIILHANVDGTAPTGSYIKWESSNGNFDEDANGYDLEIIAKNKGWTTFTAILCDADGNELARDSVEMYSKSGFFDKIGGFFRGLFGMTKIYEN